ncbi:MAG: hybrid sensor histidine kinase/response regulator, partial [Bacteroidales bacterium]|nr:hybrid sensor histidine kinase/response regulator [Bacteroidales bacterium]
MEKDNNPKILIIDDIAANIQVAANTLKKNNFNISYAKSGKLGIERAKKIPFDLILLDIMMPEMDGYQVCNELKKYEETRNIPIIFLTAKADEESIKKGFECGGVDYIAKPFKINELLARVNAHINLKIVQEKLRRINDKLQIESNNKDRLLSIIAHDLRNPFSVLITFSKLLIDSYDDFSKEDIISYLKTFYKTSKQGYNLLDNLLKWSQSQTGAMDVNPERIDLNDLTEETITLLFSQAKNKNIRLVNHVAPNTYAFADLNMVLTVLRNLISNAIKFTQINGKIEIYGGDIGKEVKITVEDTGVGISEEDLEKIFRIDIKHTTPGTS